MTAILGPAQASAAQLATWFHSKRGEPSTLSCSIGELIGFYLAEGADQGVAGDLAFCQAVHETGWFTFGAQVSPSQNNFSGLGATNDGAAGATFPDPQTGVRAQIQHLYAYAKGGPTAHPVVDPRYSLVPAGSVTTWEGLDGHWAVPDQAAGGTGTGGRPVETWCPFATIERGPYDDGSHGGPVTAHDGLAEHVSTNWADPGPFFARPVNGASSHFWIRKDGELVEYLPLEVASWAQAAGNYSYVSVETDGTPDVALSAEQVATFARLYAWVEAHPAFGGFGYQLAESPGQKGLGWHGMGGAAWGGHTGCPGDLRKAQRPAILAAAAQGHAAPAPAPTPAPTTSATDPLTEVVMSIAKSDQDAARGRARELWAAATNEEPDEKTLEIIVYAGLTNGYEAMVTSVLDSPLAQTVRAARVARDNG
jgi:hypothetical protein